MASKSAKQRFLLVLLVLVMGTLACGLPSKQNAAPPTTEPMTEQEAQQFEQDLQATLANPEPGQTVTISIDERQISSYLANRLAQEENQIVSNPRIRLTNGSVEAYLQINQGGNLDAIAVIAPSVDSAGQVHLKVDSVKVGSLSLPDSVINQIQDLVDRLLTEYLESADARFTITNIEIAEGKLLVTGTAN